MKSTCLKIVVLCLIGVAAIMLVIPLREMRDISRNLQSSSQKIIGAFSQKQEQILPVPKRRLTGIDDTPLAGVRQKGLVKHLPSREEIKLMDADAIWKTYHSYTDNIDIVCERKIRMGHIGDGGWEICDDLPYRPVKPCIVYSFGINNDFSFDDDTVKLYGCDVYSFDPSMAMKSQRRNPHNLFYQLGIGGKDESHKSKKWALKTFTSIRKMLNHTKNIIDVLKMDVEGAEWQSLNNMIEKGELKTIRQLLIEFHSPKDIKHAEGVVRLSVLSDIEKLGFRRFLVHKNPACQFRSKDLFPIIRTLCQEVHYINTNKLP